MLRAKGTVTHSTADQHCVGSLLGHLFLAISSLLFHSIRGIWTQRYEAKSQNCLACPFLRSAGNLPEFSGNLGRTSKPQRVWCSAREPGAAVQKAVWRQIVVQGCRFMQERLVSPEGFD
jgi:hypothetical protein